VSAMVLSQTDPQSLKINKGKKSEMTCREHNPMMETSVGVVKNLVKRKKKQTLPDGAAGKITGKKQSTVPKRDNRRRLVLALQRRYVKGGGGLDRGGGGVGLRLRWVF